MRRDGRSVLVVDDDRINRTMLMKLLKHEGYRASTAADGKEALAALEEERFDAVLLDMVMPEVDGMEVLRTLKRDARLWHIPVIVISAVDDTDSIVACLELGAEDYVQKPFDPVLLRARLNACLARNRFQALEVEYQKMVEEQAAELEGLRRGNGGAAESAPRAAASSPRRAHVAVVAAVLGGTGDLAALADPADTYEILAGFSATIETLAARWGGTVTGRDGDAATVVFEGPGAAGAAVAMAGGLGDVIRSSLGAWIDRGGTALTCGVGVGSGDVTLGAPIHGLPPVAGPAVDRARALAALARGADAIMLDEATFVATRELASAEPLTDRSVAAVPAVAYRLVALVHEPPKAGSAVTD